MSGSTVGVHHRDVVVGAVVVREDDPLAGRRRKTGRSRSRSVGRESRLKIDVRTARQLGLAGAVGAHDPDVLPGVAHDRRLLAVRPRRMRYQIVAGVVGQGHAARPLGSVSVDVVLRWRAPVAARERDLAVGSRERGPGARRGKALSQRPQIRVPQRTVLAVLRIDPSTVVGRSAQASAARRYHGSSSATSDSRGALWSRSESTGSVTGHSTPTSGSSQAIPDSVSGS